MIDRPIWTSDQIEAQRVRAIEIFRSQRIIEPLEQYLAKFDEYQVVVEELLEFTLDLSDLQAHIVEVVAAPKLLEAFRYLAGPPISDDDLKVLAEASLAPGPLRRDRAMVDRIAQVVLSSIDRRRFPWVIDRRDPTESERYAAVMASAALIASQRLATARRSDGKKEQEAAVRRALLELGFREVPPRAVPTLNAAPQPGEFCGESVLGKKKTASVTNDELGRKADFIVGLWDHRILPIECKVSNSSTNSVKRLNNDAAVKAVQWRKEFGTLQMVPAAVLSGVYKLHNLESAQHGGLTLFWAHDLGQLTDWVKRAV